ncbi:MAG: CocE/NonD family hydrolase [Pseudomonadota bacterium]
MAGRAGGTTPVQAFLEEPAMQVQTPPARVIEHVWIPMSDGVRLSARIWLPSRADAAAVPAVFEYIPYRKSDLTRARDERNHPYFAKHGYASLRVDMRGSGDSEGHMPDMYSDAELSDAREVITWIAAQPWCNGSVGMFGTSWGGTASLQAAVDAPPALKAIIAVCATHDRYHDDIHHMGGLLLTDSIEWGATLPAILAAPPSPNDDDWYTRWLDRLAHITFPLEAWIREEARTPYWKHGSVVDQADRLSCPALMVGGWSDRYSNSVMTLASLNPEMVWGIVGPWGHHYPDAAHPGPGIGFQQEATEWWDHWLQNAPPPAPWPKLRLWQRSFDEPGDALDVRTGEWIELSEGAANTTIKTLFPSNLGLMQAPISKPETATVPYNLTVGHSAGDTGYFGRYGGLPLDQGVDDEAALVFDSDPLNDAITLIGATEVVLVISSDQPLGQIVLRLNDVASDGRVARVGLAAANLAVSADDETAEPMTPGVARRITLRFPTTVYRFQPGHRIRLALSASYWPWIWPSPTPTRLSLALEECALRLPVTYEDPPGLGKPFALPEPQSQHHEWLATPKLQRHASVKNGCRKTSWHQPKLQIRFPELDVTLGIETTFKQALDVADPLTASAEVTHRMRIDRPDGTASIRCHVSVTTDRCAFQLNGDLSVTWNADQIHQQSWIKNVPRKIG